MMNIFDDRYPLLSWVASPSNLSISDFVSLLHRAFHSELDVIQVREKSLSDKEIVSLMQTTIPSIRNPLPRVVLNRRADLALTLGFDGVHLTSQGPSASVVRRIAPKGFVIGKSTHSLEEARLAEAQGVDYIYFGPIFPTPSKLGFGKPQGLDRLNRLCRSVSIPVFAIGGITIENAAQVFSCGARGLAAIRCFQDTEDLTALIQALKRSGIGNSS